MPPQCTEQVPDQKKQVAAFVSTNIRRNDNFLVHSIEDLTKWNESEKKKKQHLKQKTKVIAHKYFDWTPSRMTLD